MTVDTINVIRPTLQYVTVVHATPERIDIIDTPNPARIDLVAPTTPSHVDVISSAATTRIDVVDTP